MGRYTVILGNFNTPSMVDRKVDKNIGKDIGDLNNIMSHFI